MPLVSGVPPPPATLEMLAESSRDLPVKGATVIPPVEPAPRQLRSLLLLMIPWLIWWDPVLKPLRNLALMLQMYESL